MANTKNSGNLAVGQLFCPESSHDPTAQLSRLSLLGFDSMRQLFQPIDLCCQAVIVDDHGQLN